MIKKLLELIVIIVAIIIALGVIVSIVRSPDTTESPSKEVSKPEPVVRSSPPPKPKTKSSLKVVTKPKPVVNPSPPVQPKKPDSNLKFGLTEGQRKSLFQEIVKAQDEAEKRAEKKYPAGAIQTLKAGEMFILTKETPLMPEFRPSNAMAAIGEIKYLPPQIFIKALQEEDDNGNPWFYVRASNRTGILGTGWINSSALLNQVGRDLVLNQMKKQGIATRRLYKRINTEIAEKYDITVEQLKKITVEGVEKNWLMRP